MKKGTMVLMGIAGFFFVKGVFFPDRFFNLGYSVIRNENLAWLFMGLAAIAGDAVWDKWKHLSNNLVMYNYSSSLNPNDVNKVGDWVVARAGGINVTGFNQKGKEATVVAPVASFEWLEQDAFFHAVAIPKDIDALPPLVKKFIESEDFPDKKIYLGIAPSEIEHYNEAFVEWKEEWEKENVAKNTKADIMESVMERAEDLAEWAKRTDKGKNKAIGDMERKYENLKKQMSGDSD